MKLSHDTYQTETFSGNFFKTRTIQTINLSSHYIDDIVYMQGEGLGKALIHQLAMKIGKN